MQAAKRLPVLLDCIITSFPVWQTGHVPMVFSWSLACCNALVSCLPIVFSFSSSFCKAGFNVLMVSATTVSFLSVFVWIWFIFSSSFRVSLIDVMVGQYCSRIVRTVEPRGVIVIFSFWMYFRLWSVCMMSARVALVPICCCSIFLRMVLGLYRGGGWVCFSSRIIFLMGMVCPSFTDGRIVSSGVM